MINFGVANAAQLRLSLVVQNVDWRWRKSHQNKNRTAPRPFGEERETCGSESVPTGGEPPLAHASGYKKAVGACTCQAANSPWIASAVLRDSGLRRCSSWASGAISFPHKLLLTQPTRHPQPSRQAQTTPSRQARATTRHINASRTPLTPHREDSSAPARLC